MLRVAILVKVVCLNVGADDTAHSLRMPVAALVRIPVMWARVEAKRRWLFFPLETRPT
jgi:nicotinamide mononucleotide adenylyltransferase